jgi:hypothetical protein
MCVSSRNIIAVDNTVVWRPTGFVLGPLLFMLYAAELQACIEKHGLTPHLYADDT